LHDAWRTTSSSGVHNLTRFSRGRARLSGWAQIARDLEACALGMRRRRRELGHQRRVEPARDLTTCYWHGACSGCPHATHGETLALYSGRAGGIRRRTSGDETILRRAASYSGRDVRSRATSATSPAEPAGKTAARSDEPRRKRNRTRYPARGRTRLRCAAISGRGASGKRLRARPTHQL
jgi:hypothetical protein